MTTDSLFLNLTTFFPVHATPSTTFEKTSAIATTEPIITLTIIVVSNQVPYYYVVSYIALEYIDYWTRLNIDFNALLSDNNG